MEAMTLSQYAEAEGISYEAVRQQVKRNEKALAGHIFIKGGVKFLDEWAVDYLRERRRANPVVIQRVDQTDEIEALQKRVEDLTARLLAAHDALKELEADRNATKDKLIALHEREALYLQERAESAELREERDHLRDQIEAAEAREAIAQQTADLRQAEADQAREEADQLRSERDALQKEVGSFKRSWFGFYRKT